MFTLAKNNFMETASPIFILYVASQESSKEFYRSVLLIDPILDVLGMTEFMITRHSKLGLMPENNIAVLLGNTVPHPSTGNGIPRSELYLYVENPQAYYARAILFGAKPISELQKRSWGDKAAYCADIDGHIIAFATKN